MFVNLPPWTGNRDLQETMDHSNSSLLTWSCGINQPLIAIQPLFRQFEWTTPPQAAVVSTACQSLLNHAVDCGVLNPIANKDNSNLLNPPLTQPSLFCRFYKSMLTISFDYLVSNAPSLNNSILKGGKYSKGTLLRAKRSKSRTVPHKGPVPRLSLQTTVPRNRKHLG